MLSKEQILSVTDKAVKEITVPEWQGTVFIRGITIDDMEYIKGLDSDDPTNVLRQVIRFVSDAEGNLLFTESDIPALKKKAVSAWKYVLQEVNKFAGLEEAEKNS